MASKKPPTKPQTAEPKKDKSPVWTSAQLNRNVFQLKIPLQKNRAWEYWFLLTSDQHWDNPHSNHELQLKHLNEAKERGAGVMSAGDLFCLMQGKYDKRSNKSSVRPEHQVDNYIDAVIKTAADFFEPYANNFITIATGNHEQAIQDRSEINVVDRFVGILNDRTGSQIHNGGFSGWIIFSFHEERENGGRRTRVVLHYDHGYGGGGPVTEDMIQHYRRAVYLPDADIVLSGHTHGSFSREIPRVRLTSDGTVRHDIQTHLKIPSYKDEYGDGWGGWATAKKGMPPKPQGAWWLKFYWCGQKERVVYDAIRAS